MPMMLAVACIAMLVPTGLVHGLLPPLQDAGKGWSSLTKIPSCLWQLCDSLSSGRASKINPACCSSINQWHYYLYENTAALCTMDPQ
ncbi:hypothetical protein CUMW_029180 [Citrus unshiu]|nr:hypothetical protein CUMW_029180 [Citrus unshiu]